MDADNCSYLKYNVYIFEIDTSSKFSITIFQLYSQMFVFCFAHYGWADHANVFVCKKKLLKQTEIAISSRGNSCNCC